MFTPTTWPVVYPIITDVTTSILRSRTKTFHKSLWHNFNLHEAAKRGYCAFIINAIEGTWIPELQHVDTIYSDVTNKALMDHLQLCCSGIHAIDIVDITSEIITYYGDAAGVLKYINMLKDAQKKT